ncbi:unnamed protein product [Vitrella brassicaformis CCMP3155]|uniref:Chromatin modification-related protein MEAF6 n=2 Tax=Vitrella brassicaformis TaxID=1169539 RepID=A0A0G4GDM3_VITBC|nr:unnamed protein product [Vitrella brassicaformis CCMP3155]|eukprot:CEM27102.1 unnamed protein product [Vitrella brassicaformis CCMP3155]
MKKLRENLAKHLEVREKSIFSMEGDYLTEHVQGNIVQGWEGYHTRHGKFPVKLPVLLVRSGDGLDAHPLVAPPAAPPAPPAPYVPQMRDRLFSQSSITSPVYLRDEHGLVLRPDPLPTPPAAPEPSAAAAADDVDKGGEDGGHGESEAAAAASGAGGGQEDKKGGAEGDDGKTAAAEAAGKGERAAGGEGVGA